MDNFPSGTAWIVLEKVEDLIKKKAGCLIIHTRTNDFTKGKIVLIAVIKGEKKCVCCPETKVVFWVVILFENTKRIFI